MIKEISISIVIPVFKLLYADNLSFFTKLVYSISLNFNNYPNIKEIIVVDDFPEEDVEDKVREIFVQVGLHQILKIIRNKENLGQAASRNIGATFATGNYLHFIDQDDFIGDGFYKNFKDKNQASSKTYDLFIADIIGISMKGEVSFSILKEKTKKVYQKADNLKDLFWFLLSNIVVSPGQYIISKKAFISINGFPDLQNKGSDDFGLMFNLVSGGKESPICFLEQSKFYYRMHVAQNSKSLNLLNSCREFYHLAKSTFKLSFKEEILFFLRLNGFLSKTILPIRYYYWFNVK